MQSKVEYISLVFKIDMVNPYIVTDVAEEIQKMDSFDDFRKWLKININHIDAKYMSGFQKFTFLVNIYLKHRLEYINAKRIIKGKEYAFILADKVRQVSPYVGDAGVSYKKFKIKKNNNNDERIEAFSDFDKSQLEKVGGLFSAVKLLTSISGRNALIEKLEELAYDILVTNVLEHKPIIKETSKNISTLLTASVKKI